MTLYTALYEAPCHGLGHGSGADEPDSRLDIRSGSPRGGSPEIDNDA